MGCVLTIDVAYFVISYSALSSGFCMLECGRFRIIYVTVLVDWVKFVVLPTPIYFELVSYCAILLVVYI